MFAENVSRDKGAFLVADLKLHQVFDGGKVQAVGRGDELNAAITLDRSGEERIVSGPDVEILVHLRQGDTESVHAV